MNQAEPDYLDAKAASSFLGVKAASLYSYVSRGKIRVVPGPDGRTNRYRRTDLERLKTRREARSGHAAVASDALRWGAPMLDSSITRISAAGPVYRGFTATALAANTPFRSVAELLWTGDLPDTTPDWPKPRLPADWRAMQRLVDRASGPISRLQLLVPALALYDDTRFRAPRHDDLARARRLVTLAAAALFPEPGLLESLNSALVVIADHELNASTFAARVAASTGADLYSCVSAALATLSGHRHGGACDRIEALVAEVQAAGGGEAAGRVVADRLRRGESISGFGRMVLYPDGDPRTPPLLAFARETRAHGARLDALFGLVEAMARAGHGAPLVDTGLVAVSLALGLPRGMAAGIFALGRMAGWIAHVFEQRDAGYMLRPRANYTGEATT